MLIVNGGKRLEGSIKIQGSKNSVLPILAASILAGEETVIHNAPGLSDADAAIRILRYLGCKVSRQGNTVAVDPTTMDRYEIPNSLMREMRSSVVFLGAILAKMGKAVLSMPGGCELGPRPIDLHLKALESLGAEIEAIGGKIYCSAKNLIGTRIDLPIPSVGATENAMIAAAGSFGTTTITNAAKEPEIEDLQSFLNKIGAEVSGAGTSIITIKGASSFKGCEHHVIPDRIAAATYMSAAAGSGGNIYITDIIPKHIAPVSDALRQMGCEIYYTNNSVHLISKGMLKAPKPVITRPHPGFPTDAQPTVMAACLKAEGTSVFVENIFESRYRHVPEFLRMGASVKLEGRVAIVSGVKKLHGALVESHDLRGGAALAVAALSANGTTYISNLSHIDRGYEDFEGVLQSIGADIVRSDYIQ